MISQDLILQKLNSLPPQKVDEVIDFIDFLAEKESTNEKTKRFSMVAEYALANGGTEFDLDENLEQAGIENLLAIDGAKN
jgi:hypothetical protein